MTTAAETSPEATSDNLSLDDAAGLIAAEPEEKPPAEGEDPEDEEEAPAAEDEESKGEEKGESEEEEEAEEEEEPEADADNAVTEGDDSPLAASEIAKALEIEETDLLDTMTVSVGEDQVAVKDLLRVFNEAPELTRDANALTQARAEFDSEKAAKAQELDKQFGQLQTLTARLVKQIETDSEQYTEEKLAELERDDPVEFARVVARRQVQREAAAASIQALRDEGERREQEQAKLRQEWESREGEALLAKVPEWNDESKAKAEATEIMEFLKAEYGADDEFLASFLDHRSILIARDAFRFRTKVKRGRPRRGKLENLPRVVKPQARQVQRSSRERASEAAGRRLRKTGSVKDAASAIESMME